MEAATWISAASALFALSALVVSFFASRFAREAATGDFQATQKVMLDTAELIAVLRSLMHKGAIYSQQPQDRRDDPAFDEFVNTMPERDAIGAFMQSSTAVAYHSFAARQSREAREAGRVGEKWRVFFLDLVTLQHTKNPFVAASQAATLERQMDTLTGTDFRAIAENLANLAKAFEVLYAEREHDLVARVFVERSKENGGVQEEDFIPLVDFLRTVKQIEDPDLDLFSAASSGDQDLLKSALTRGADVSVTAGAITSRYRDHIGDFHARQAKGAGQT